MATAVCKSCGTHYHYYCRRGMRLIDQPCPKCGGVGRTYRQKEEKTYDV